MTGLKVRDVMTAPAVSVSVDAAFKEIVDLLNERRISGVPVVDAAGRVVGVVSEADLLHKVELSGEPLEGRLFERPSHHRARVKAAGDAAAELMSAPALTVAPEDSVVTAAQRLESHGYKRLPVVDGVGDLVGVVSRRDLLRAFLRTDAQIRDEVERRVFAKTFMMTPAEARVEVADGVVTLRGELELATLLPIAIALTRAVDGVVDVDDQMTFTVDNRRETRPTWGPVA